MKAFLDDHQIVSAWVPIDICAPGGVATTSDYVCLKNWEKCLIVLFKAAGTAGDDPTITLDQATAVAGTDTKTLACITKSWIKTGAALNAIGAFTAAAQTANTGKTGCSVSSMSILASGWPPIACGAG